MKTKLLKRIPAVLILGLAPVAVMIITARAADKADAPNQAVVAPLPERPPLVTDDGWKDPGVILSNIMWEDLPLSEVTRYLQSECKNSFEVLLPRDLQYLTTARPGIEQVDVTSIPIKLHLKKVTVTEVFNAMNIMFETENAPWTWELLMNGNRPTAVFRVLPELLTIAQPSPEQAPKRMVFFVGDLAGYGRPGGMTMEEITKTVTEVCATAYPGLASRNLKFHNAAQLLVVTGTPEEIQFVESTLKALNEKVRRADTMERYREQEAAKALKQKATLETERKAQTTDAEPKPKSEATKTP